MGILNGYRFRTNTDDSNYHRAYAIPQNIGHRPQRMAVGAQEQANRYSGLLSGFHSVGAYGTLKGFSRIAKNKL